MKKFFITLIIVFIVIIAPLMIIISDYKEQRGEITKFNLEFEQYKDKTIRGVDVASIINIAIDNNEKYEIEKNEAGIYSDDDRNCIRVELIMKSSTDDTKYVTHTMETIYSVDIDKFVKNYNLVEFECAEISYNSLGRVSKIVFKLKE